ncbi:lasso RiPP family leader peptide-containing protein [Saccharothrix sp. AJ9571]|nr:lasso RiPP family leader peptide-containing protein [Saccharothrix sp. AJ9571]
MDEIYEAPSMVEAGEFAEVTQLTHAGYWADGIWGYFWF